jgi:RNA polymerase sigma-70 factor, ECF subfamily
MTADKSPTGGDRGGHSSTNESASAPGTQERRQEDLDLMTRVAAGSAKAQVEVANRLAGRVRRLAKMMLFDESMADDAAQNSLLEILRSAHTFRGQASLERWADRITARTTIRHKRTERRHGGVELSDDLDAGTMPPPGDGMMAEATPRGLVHYLEALSDAQREAIVLKHSFEYTTEEIAELTDTAVGTVKDRLVAGRRHLRKLIQRDLNLASRGGHRDDE